MWPATGDVCARARIALAAMGSAIGFSTPFCNGDETLDNNPSGRAYLHKNWRTSSRQPASHCGRDHEGCGALGAGHHCCSIACSNDLQGRRPSAGFIRTGRRRGIRERPDSGSVMAVGCDFDRRPVDCARLALALAGVARFSVPRPQASRGSGSVRAQQPRAAVANLSQKKSI